MGGGGKDLGFILDHQIARSYILLGLHRYEGNVYVQYALRNVHLTYIISILVSIMTSFPNQFWCEIFSSNYFLLNNHTFLLT